MLRDVLHDADVQPLEQRDAAREAFIEVDFPAHRGFRDGPDFGADAGAVGQFVDAFGLDEGGVHVEADEPPHPPVHVVPLEGEIHPHLGGEAHQALLHHLLVLGRAAERELDAGAGVPLGMRDAQPAGEALDGVDVQPLLGHDLGRGLDLRGGEAPADDGEDVARPALPGGPLFVLVVRNRLETDLHAQFRGLEQEFFHHLSGMRFVDADQDAEGQGGMDVGLADVQDLGVVAGENFHEGGGESDPVLAGDADENLFVSHSTKIRIFAGYLLHLSLE